MDALVHFKCSVKHVPCLMQSHWQTHCKVWLLLLFFKIDECFCQNRSTQIASLPSHSQPRQLDNEPFPLVLAWKMNKASPNRPESRAKKKKERKKEEKECTQIGSHLFSWGGDRKGTRAHLKPWGGNVAPLNKPTQAGMNGSPMRGKFAPVALHW